MAGSAEAVRRAPRVPGWEVVAGKELADHLLSARFGVLLVLLGLAVVGTVYAAASGIREIAPQASEAPALFLRLFTVRPGDRIPFSFFEMVSFLAPLLGIAFGFDAVNSERSQGTLPRLLSQPIHRDDVINGKFVAGLVVVGMILTSLTVLVAAIGMVRLGIAPSLPEVMRVMVWLGVAIVYVGFWLAFATLLSVMVTRAATSALVSISTWLVLTLFLGLLIGLVADALAPPETTEQAIRNVRLQLSMARLSPSTLYEEATVVLLNPQVRTLTPSFLLTLEQVDRAVPSTLSLQQSLLLVWPQVVALLAITAICFAAAYILFLRQEVRA